MRYVFMAAFLLNLFFVVKYYRKRFKEVDDLLKFVENESKTPFPLIVEEIEKKKNAMNDDKKVCHALFFVAFLPGFLLLLSVAFGANPGLIIIPIWFLGSIIFETKVESSERLAIRLAYSILAEREHRWSNNYTISPYVSPEKEKDDGAAETR